MSRRKQVGAALAAMAMAAAAVFGVSQIAGGNPSDDLAASSSAPSTAPPDPEPQQTSASPTPASPTPTQSSTPTPTPTAKPTPKAMLQPGDEGDKVRELQARLKQIAWYAPKINGKYDEITADAVSGFQEKRGFKVTGLVDDKTWDRLIEMTREPTDDEKHNRLTPGPTIIGPGSEESKVRELQARLNQIGWFNHEVTGTYGDVTTSAVAGFQRKRGFPETGEVDQRTWDRLMEMTREPTDDEMYNREPEDDGTDAANLDPRCLTGRAMCADKSTNTLSWVVDGDVKLALAVRFGCKDERETREGQFSVGWKSRDHVSSLYDTPMPFAMFFSGGQAVHYSEDFANRGYEGCSHGCINVKNYDGIAWLFDQVQVGDKVVVYWS